MEQANCIGPTRICAGVGIQNLLSWLKSEQLWKLFPMGSSSLTCRTFFSSSATGLPPVFGNPMCKATATCSTFSSFTSKPSFCTPWSSFEGFNPLTMGKNWIVSRTSSCCWVKEGGGYDDDSEQVVRDEDDGLSHSMKFGVWRYKFLSSTLHSLKPISERVVPWFVKSSPQKRAIYPRFMWEKPALIKGGFSCPYEAFLFLFFSLSLFTLNFFFFP